MASLSPRPLPTQKEIARLAGVSQVTVSAVLNGANHTRTRPETRKRIVSIAKKLNYRIQRHARLMKVGKSGTIALVCASQFLETVYLRSNLATDFVRAAGYFPRLYDKRWMGGDFTELWNDMRQERPEGVLLLGGLTLMTPGVRALIFSLDVPIVSISGPKLDGIPLLIPDYRKGFYEIARHLAGNGRRRIALIMRKASAYQKAYRWQDERRSGYLQAMEELGLKPRVHDYEVPNTERHSGQHADSIRFHRMDHSRHGYDFARPRLRNKRPSDDAWMFFNDALAFGALRALGEVGVEVPGELAVTGSDGETQAMYGYLPLTTLVQPLVEMTEEGVALLTKMIRDKQPRLEFVRRIPPTIRHGATG